MNSAKTKRVQKVFEYFKAQGETQDTFAARLGITQAHLSRLLRGLTPFLHQHVILFESVYNVNPDWLNTGKGDMIVNVKPTTKDVRLNKIIRIYNELDERKKDKLYEISVELFKSKTSDLMKVADKTRKYVKK